MLLALILAEPKMPPKKVKLKWIRKTSAQLSWKAIPCPGQNGMILWYLVRIDYKLPNGTFAMQQSKTSWDTLKATLINLLPNWKYSVRVAGVNQAGVGAFSLPLEFITLGGMYQQTHAHLLKHSQYYFSLVTQFVQAECKSHPPRELSTI